MLKEERCRLILNHLQKDKKVYLNDLSKEFNVSSDTIRRDIKELSAQRLCREVRGGAIPHSPGPHNLRERENFAGKQKQIIAQKAAGLIKKGQTILLDGGTSTLAVASVLPENMDLTIFTNSFPILDVLGERNDIQVFFAGGKFLRHSYVTTGHDTLNFFHSIRADICFLGVCSIDLHVGITGHYYDECAVKKSMIKASGQVFALATPEKVNTAEAFQICRLNDLEGMITSSPESDLFKPYKQAEIRII